MWYRTTTALATKRANGERTGQVPYGLDVADDGVALVSNECKQSFLRDIVAMREAAEKLQGITDARTERGIPTKTGNTTWNLSTVCGILTGTGVKRGQPAAQGFALCCLRLLLADDHEDTDGHQDQGARIRDKSHAEADARLMLRR